MEVSNDDYQIFANHRMIDGDDNITFGHHLGPDMKRLSRYPAAELPTFLFRTYSDQSMGVNSPESFQSEYYRLSPGESFLFAEMPYTRIKVYLQDHTNNSKTRDSLFVSFSASLLATLQRAEWQKVNGHKNVHVAVLNTKSLQGNQLMLPLSVLQRAFGFVETRPYISMDCTDEFLAWGRLDVPTNHVPHQQLLLYGLHKLLPELNENVGNKQLGAQLARLRKVLFDRTALATVTQLEPPRILSLAQALTEVLSGSYRLGDKIVLLLCVLSLRDYGMTRKPLEHYVMAGFGAWLRERFLTDENDVNLEPVLWTNFSWRTALSDKPELLLHQGFCHHIISTFELAQRFLAGQAKESLLDKYLAAYTELCSEYHQRGGRDDQVGIMQHVYGALSPTLGSLRATLYKCDTLPLDALFAPESIEALKDDLRAMRSLTDMLKETITC